MTLDVPVELRVEAVKESVTVTANAAPPASTYSSDQSVINKSTALNAPNKQDRVDTFLPLIPGVHTDMNASDHYPISSRSGSLKECRQVVAQKFKSKSNELASGGAILCMMRQGSQFTANMSVQI